MSTLQRYPPISPKCPAFLHGGDYNPDQWLATPEVWDEDVRLMKAAGCNAMSIGIFSWAALEPEEGRFTFDWLDTIMDKLAAKQVYAILATPSGAKPAWMSARYPEIRRVTVNGQRERHQGRHNHCRASPVYREKCRMINTRIAQRYQSHPALIAWHVSNEYNGEPCYCGLCLGTFRNWLRRKYQDDLGRLNQAWWTGFWSHTFTDWNQIYPDDATLHGMMLDWTRFNTEQAIDFFMYEAGPLRSLTPKIPVTTNFMGLCPTLDYWKFARAVDVISWDSYPSWHAPWGNAQVACETAFTHDINRSMKGGRPFMLMESTPSMTNWQTVSKLKRPGMHLLASLQAVAHGSDTVQYFQWRKGRGGVEKFHGAVVDHCGHEKTRVFEDVAEVGRSLERLAPVLGTTVRPEVAVVYDWETRWAVDNIQGLGRDLKKYAETVISHYQPFWANGIPVDVIDQTVALEGYRLVITPMMYLLRPGMAQKLSAFVAAGGTWVATYWTGIVDENDLCFTGGWPGAGLREVLGIWDEEIDAGYPLDRNHVAMKAGNALGMKGRFEASELFGLIHAEKARVLATYADDFYKGRPAVTVNSFQKGEAYYLAARTEADFQDAFYGALIDRMKFTPALAARLPPGVSAQIRSDGKQDYVFVMNFNDKPVKLTLKAKPARRDLLSGKAMKGALTLPPYGVKVLESLAGSRSAKAG